MASCSPRMRYCARRYAFDQDYTPACRCDCADSLRRPPRVGAQVVLSPRAAAHVDARTGQCTAGEQHPAPVSQILGRADSAAGEQTCTC